MNLSILVPTMNRHFFCKRLINYYKNINFKGQLFILDSSDQENADKNYKFIKDCNDISINYINEKGSAFVIQKKIASEIKTDYVTYSGDDDYFLISGMKSIISFLEKNNEFIGANGKSYNIVCDGKFSEKILLTYPWIQTSRLEESSFERLKFQIKNYTVPVFSIFRKNFYLKMLNSVPTLEEVKNLCPEKEICDELIPAFTLASYGKIASLQNIHLFRTLHNPKFYKQSNFLKREKNKKKRKENFSKSFHYLKNILSKLQLDIEKRPISKTQSMINDEYLKNERSIMIKKKISLIKNYIFFIYKIYNNFKSKAQNSSIESFLKQYNFKTQNNEIALIYKSIKNTDI